MKPFFANQVADDMIRAYTLGYVHGALGAPPLYELTKAQQTVVDAARAVAPLPTLPTCDTCPRWTGGECTRDCSFYRKTP